MYMLFTINSLFIEFEDPQAVKATVDKVWQLLGKFVGIFHHRGTEKKENAQRKEFFFARAKNNNPVFSLCALPFSLRLCGEKICLGLTTEK